MRPELLDDIDLAPGLPHPGPRSYEEYRTYIEEDLPPESPTLFGMHPNAEINFMTQQSEALFQARAASGRGDRSF
jgi:dynein heavy chain